MSDEDRLQLEVTELEASLVTDDENLIKLCRLADIYIALDRKPKGKIHLDKAIKVFSETQLSASQGFPIVECALKFWKGMKYLNKDSLRVNYTQERAKLLGEIHGILLILMKMHDTVLGQKISLTMAFVKESSGQYQDALAILSDLITAQAMDVDLTYVIFRAAVLLSHIGGYTQAIEYLEFLLDEPPVSEGYTKTHVLAFLASVYERSGDRYISVLEKTYDELLEAYTKDLAAGKRPLTNQKKIENMLSKKTVAQSSEIWEMLALQAVDKCEYVLAAEMMQQAVEKAPTKGRLLHILAEVYLFLGERDRSSKEDERAFVYQPNSSDLRNLLLIVNREKWQEKLRSVGASKEEISKEEEEKQIHARGMKMQKVEDAEQNTGEHWTTKLANKASTAIQVAQKEGAMGLLASLSGTPEQRAREAADKERKRRIRAERKKRKDDEKAVHEEATKKIEAAKNRLRNIEKDGPARPDKPSYSEESNRIINQIRSGNQNLYLYDPNLKILASIRERVEREEKEREERKTKLAAVSKPNSSSTKSRSTTPKKKKK